MPVGVLRWDGWPSALDTNINLIDTRVGSNAEADWNSRTPTLGWGMYGTGVDAQAHADATINYAADAGIDFFEFLCILPPEIYHGTPDTDPLREPISIPFQRYLSSPYKSRIKHMLLLQSMSLRYPYTGQFGTPADDFTGGAYLAAWGAFVAAKIADPQYLRINGLAVVGLFQSTWMPTAMWNVFLAAVGTPIMLIDWNRDVTDGTRLGAFANTSYPPNPAVISVAGQNAYSAVVAGDITLSNPAGLNITSLVTQCQDQRPLTTTGIDKVCAWADRQTMPDAMAHTAAMGRFKPSGVVPLWMNLHSWNEHFEDGPGLEPTVEEGTRFLDQFRFAKHPQTRPTTYTYRLSTEHAACVKTGTWRTPSNDATCRKLGSACFANAVVGSSTASDTLALTHIAWSQATIYGTTQSGGGQFTVQVNGSTVATVSTSAGSTTHHVALWNGSFTEGTNTVQITVVGNGPIEVDAVELVWNPSRAPL